LTEDLRSARVERKLSELPALVASLLRLSDEEAASFADDIEAARSELGRLPDRDPWES
jgi:hypothetical protein